MNREIVAKRREWAAKRSAWLLKYMQSRHPRGLSETAPLSIEGRNLGVGMQTMKGLEKRGLVNSPVSGLWYLTEKGLNA